MAYENSHDQTKAIEEEARPHATELELNANPRALQSRGVNDGSVSYIKAQELTNRILRFLSTASNETLGACALGLASITYFVLGRVGLVIIGVVGGVILHATWEENIQNHASGRTEASVASWRKETSLNVVDRVLDWRDRQQGKGVHGTDFVQDVAYKISAREELDFSGFQPATAAALGALTDAVIRDYVKYGIASFFFLVIC